MPADTAVFFHDLQTGVQWGYQEDVQFPAASVIKVPIMMELFRQKLDLGQTFVLEDRHRVGGAGVLHELSTGTTVTLLDLCRLMIIISDNVASNALLDRVGPANVNAWMQQHGMQAHLGRRFMEPATPERDNRMSARDAARCIEVAIRDPRALEILEKQQYREKIPLMLPPGIKVAHKTGELEGVRHDAGLIDGRIILAMLTRNGKEPWEVDLALARLAKAVYEGASTA